jgi:spore coat protein CotH
MKRLSLLFPVLLACSSGDPAATPAAAKEDCKTDCGPKYVDFFAEDKVATLHITFGPEVTAPDTCQTVDGVEVCHPNDAAWLNYLWTKWAHCPGGEFVPAEVRYESPDGRGNVTMQNVGVRLRGSKTRGANAIQGMKLDFDIAPGERDLNGGKRRFADLNRLNLLSIEGSGIKNKEASLMIQCLAYGMMRKWGVPAPQCNHLNVYVNGKFHGVFQNAEVVADGRYLKHAFDDDDGTLYEASSGCPPYRDSNAKLQYEETAGDRFVYPYSPVEVPATVPAINASYEVIEYAEADDGAAGGGNVPTEEPVKPAEMSRDEWSVISHPEKSAHAEAELIPMLKCGDVDTTPDEAEFKACIQEWIDLPEWLDTLAGESVMPTVESFMVMRNYYLYFKPDAEAPHGGRFVLYSWDYDTVFHRQACYPSDCNPFTSVAGWYVPNPRAALALRIQNAFKAEYCAALNRFVSEAFRPELVDEMANVLRPSIDLVQGGFINKDGNPVVSVEDWQAEVDTIREFIVNRTVEVQAQIDAACN